MHCSRDALRAGRRQVPTNAASAQRTRAACLEQQGGRARRPLEA